MPVIQPASEETHSNVDLTEEFDGTVRQESEDDYENTCVEQEHLSLRPQHKRQPSE